MHQSRVRHAVRSSIRKWITPVPISRVCYGSNCCVSHRLDMQHNDLLMRSLRDFWRRARRHLRGCLSYRCLLRRRYCHDRVAHRVSSPTSYLDGVRAVLWCRKEDGMVRHVRLLHPFLTLASLFRRCRYITTRATSRCPRSTRILPSVHHIV